MSSTGRTEKPTAYKNFRRNVRTRVFFLLWSDSVSPLWSARARRHGDGRSSEDTVPDLLPSSTGRSEAPDYTGMDVIIVRNRKIAALYVFLDSMPS
jgi:hypothetical protein